jgi:hypothetical protein
VKISTGHAVHYSGMVNQDLSTFDPRSSILNTGLFSEELASCPLRRGLEDAHVVTAHFKSTTQQAKIHFRLSPSH